MIIYRRTMQVYMDKLEEASKIATEQAKIYEELTGEDYHPVDGARHVR